MYTNCGYRSQTYQELTLGATKQGQITLIKHIGTSLTSMFEDFVEPVGAATTMIYACPNLEVKYRLGRTNTGTPTFMRAPGEAPGMFALESAMDELAYALNLDPIDIRLHNHADIDPQTGLPWSSKSLQQCYQKGAEIFGWSQRHPTPRAMQDGNFLIGWGMASATFPTNSMSANVKVEVFATGEVSVQTGTQDIGTGTYTVMTQVAAEALGLPSQPVHFTLGDSIQTNDLRLQKLPWHLWDLLERYPKAEIALSAPSYEQVSRNSPPQSQVKVLAILGNSQGIDIQTDSQLLAELPYANTTFLVEPSGKDLTDQLWEQDWQILFFAGHSATDGSGDAGKIYINQTESLTISQLKYGLRKAVERGLHLAIFNSCDGLGLAREFADLHIPQIIVMREPVPDRVAQEFLKYFLEAFARGESLYIAVREARERLQGLETQFPCATWLPVIYQNPATMPLLWRELHLNQNSQQITTLPKTPTRRGINLREALSAVMLTSIVTTALLMGVRYFGLLQSWELMAFDHLLRLRPQEKPDSRILVIEITEEDVQAQSPNRRGSLSDEALDKLLAKLEAYQPRVIGLDIYRDYAVQPTYPKLAERMRTSDRFVAVCQVSNPQTGKP
jgi:hypothetical protein